MLIALITALALDAKNGDDCRHITMGDGLASNTVRNIVQDKHGYMWMGTDNGLCRYDGRSVTTYRITEMGANQYISSLMANENGIFVGTEGGVFSLPYGNGQFEHLPLGISSAVTSIVGDKDGMLWVSTMQHGVWRYDPVTGRSKCYDSAALGGAVAQVMADRDNQIWAVSNWSHHPVQRLNRLSDRFEPVRLSSETDARSLRMLQTNDGKLWLGTWEHGLMRLNDDGRMENVLSPAEQKVGSHIHTLFEKADGLLCIGCDDGLLTFDTQTGKWDRILDSSLQGDRFVYAVVGDREGGLWVGTFYDGVTYISPLGTRFRALDIPEDGIAVSHVISRFCEDSRHRVWMASDDGGLICYLAAENRLASYPHQEKLGKCNVHALAVKDDQLWIGTYTDGVFVLNVSSGDLRHYMGGASGAGLDDNSCYAIFHDSRQQTWVATMKGLHVYDKGSDRFSKVGGTDALIIDIDEDPEGFLWMATQGGGLWRCHTKDKKIKAYRHDKDDSHSLPDDQVNCTLVDVGGQLWAGTQEGLCQYDRKNDRFRRIDLGIPGLNVMCIVEDQGTLWLSTQRGLVRYQAYARKETVRRFSLHDGLVSEQFLPNSGMKAVDGCIFFGTANGFNAFYPYQIKVNSVMPPVYVTSVEIINRKRATGDGKPEDLSMASQLTLNYGEAKMLTFTFAALSYCSPEKNQYAYLLEGFDSEWNHVGNQNRATYTNLPAGSYTFRVKATNNDGVWSDKEATLRVIVRPPFWWSWYAKLLYLLLAAGSIWWYVRFRLQRAERQHQHELLRLSEEKEAEVREARLNFFTMIAHEIRTPVSLIIGPIESISMSEEGEKQMPAKMRQTFDIIRRNAHRLLELVDQLLDFRKVEQHSMVMHPEQHNIHDILKVVERRFGPVLQQEGKRLSLCCEDEHLTAMVDSEGLTKVVGNLLSNARKYTKDEVWLSCRALPDGKQFCIEVTDNGKGIREEDQRRIFEPFFQAMDNKPGTGIGLHIVKSIVEQHHGSVTVSSLPGKGTSFRVVMPLGIPDMPEQPLASETMASQDGIATSVMPKTPGSSGLRPTMLIVDDSSDLVNFLSQHFINQYEVITAADGREALQKLGSSEVSIIVSDWMMPGMDGAELCRQVRRNAAVSHIPFIMLTAKTDSKSKVEGMDVGADAYIEKPFSLQYLDACIRNILDIRRQLRQKFSSMPLEPLTEMASNPTDNAFLNKMNALIEENLANSELNVNYLASQLGISRSGLFAKIKSMADMTPNEMIQVVRLKRAARLLQEGKFMVSEVGYMVGFSSPSYFSKCFHKQFGVNPAEFAKTKAHQPSGSADN